MERNLNNEDFEDFLKLKTDNYKLYPSDKVWKGIYQSLHTRKRWFRIGGGLLFLSSLLFVSYQFNDRGNVLKAAQTQNTVVAKVTDKEKAALPLQNLIIGGSITRSAAPSNKNFPGYLPDLQVLIDASSENTQSGTQGNDVAETIIADVVPINAGTINLDLDKVDVDESDNISETEVTTDVEAAEKDTDKTIFTESIERTKHDGTEINWLQEMAALRLTSIRSHKLKLQFYFSPTISFRKLTDGNKEKELSNAPLATNQLGINNIVVHKPSIGVELGSNILFAPIKNLTLKTGLQLNYSRYNIKAYKFYSEKANIALVSAGRIADTMSSYTSLRNFNGYFPEDLQNQYLQLSLPIGAELKLLGNKRLQLNVAGTVQPTYLLYNDTYLLSTDFINYTKEPSLLRKWNVNTSAEAFVSYYIGGMRWQVGPQFRYQTLSSYNDRYPIKEYLIEYGVKFGVSKTLR